jgi:DNA-binding MarR family transcriptional regulator
MLLSAGVNCQIGAIACCKKTSDISLYLNEKGGSMTDTCKLNLDNFLPYRLAIASTMVSTMIAGAYRSLFGLSIAEWRLITILAARGSDNQLGLGLATKMDKVTVSRAAIALVHRGLVERSPNLADKRSHLLALTESGWSLYSQVVPKALALEKAMLADFSIEEVETLTGMLLRLEATAGGLTRGETPDHPPSTPPVSNRRMRRS